jgi:hypothetical protein
MTKVEAQEKKWAKIMSWNSKTFPQMWESARKWISNTHNTTKNIVHFNLMLQLLVQLVFKSIKFMIALVITLHVTKSHARTFIGVIKFWHVPICSCKCNYLLWLLYMHFGWKGEWKVHSCQSYFITSNDKQVFTNAICPIEFTCQFLISCVVIHYY